MPENIFPVPVLRSVRGYEYLLPQSCYRKEALKSKTKNRTTWTNNKLSVDYFLCYILLRKIHVKG